MNAIILALSLIHSLPSSDKTTPEAQPALLRIRAGNTQKELIIAFGKPGSVVHGTFASTGKDYSQFIYNNEVCASDVCSVFVENGVVTKFHGVKPELSNY